MDAISIYIDVQICMVSYILQLISLSTCFLNINAIYIKYIYIYIYIYIKDASENFWKMTLSTLPLPKTLSLRATLFLSL
jgi:hypothetical protein